MKSRLLVAAVGVPLTFVVLVLLPPIGTALFCAVISCVAVHEMFCAVGVKSPAAVVLGGVSALVVTFCAYERLEAYTVLAWCACYGILLFLLWVVYYENGEPFGFAGLGAGLMAGLVIPGGMASLCLIRGGTAGRFAVLLPIIITFAGDGGALFTGMAFGRHKLAAKTSPKKTIEGSIGGLFIGTACAALYAVIIRFGFDVKVNFAMLIVTAIVGGAVSQLGDLAFSLIKREFGVKDYGKILPGHGGALDRFDSTIFAAPVVCLLISALTVLQ